MASKRLFVYRNEAGSEGKVVNIQPNDNMGRLRKIVSKKLGGIQCQRLFLASGAEVQEVDEMQNNDTLYISQGEPF